VGSGFLAMYEPSVFFPFALEINTVYEFPVLWFTEKVLRTNGSELWALEEY